MKIVFMGTPEFGAICLDKLILSNHEVVAVITSKDKPSGRGNKIKFSPVKIIALKHNIPLFQFGKIRVDGVETLKKIKADIFVTASFGQILSQEIIDIPKHGIINVHGSLLPKYRGASPIQSSLLNGDTMTGVSIMKTDAGIDTGDVILQKEFNILPDDNCQTLMERCAHIGSELLIEALNQIENKTVVFQKQDESLATKTKMLKKETAKLDFNNKVEDICNKIRAYAPSPACFFEYENQIIKVFKASKTLINNIKPTPKKIEIATAKKGLIVGCCDGFIELEQIQAQNGKIMTAKAYLNGRIIKQGDFI